MRKLLIYQIAEKLNLANLTILLALYSVPCANAADQHSPHGIHAPNKAITVPQQPISLPQQQVITPQHIKQVNPVIHQNLAPLPHAAPTKMHYTPTQIMPQHQQIPRKVYQIQQHTISKHVTHETIQNMPKIQNVPKLQNVPKHITPVNVHHEIRSITPQHQVPSTVYHNVNKLPAHGTQPVIHVPNQPKTLQPVHAVNPLVPINAGPNKPLRSINVKPINPSHVIKNINPSHLSNNFTKINIQKSAQLNHHFINSPRNAIWFNQVNAYKQSYNHHFHQSYIHKFQIYNQFWHNPHFHFWYQPWFQWGFFGGFWYPVREVFIQEYFYYPDVQWFYVEEPVPVEYYQDYYPEEPLPPPSCQVTFPYRQVYFPTDTLRDLLVEVSGFPQYLRCHFREAVINFTDQLKDQVNNHFSVNLTFQQNDIVVNYYQNLQNRAIVIAGFVSHDQINMAFEGLLDLDNPDQSISFSPSGQNPTQEELQLLDELNNRITSLGGDPFTAQEEPETANTQLPAGEAPSPSGDTAPGP